MLLKTTNTLSFYYSSCKETQSCRTSELLDLNRLMIPAVLYVAFARKQMSINPPSGQFYGIINTSGIFPSNLL